MLITAIITFVILIIAYVVGALIAAVQYACTRSAGSGLVIDLSDEDYTVTRDADLHISSSVRSTED